MADTDLGHETLTVIYGVSVRRLTKRHRVVIEVTRDTFKKQLGYYEKSGLAFMSTKPRHFFDTSDEFRVRELCGATFKGPYRSKVQRVGSIELKFYLHNGPRVRVQYVGGVVFGEWNPAKGLVLTRNAHPVLAADKEHIAKLCSEVPQGGGGIFASVKEEPTL